MTFELPRRVVTIPRPFLIACEGYGDVRLVDKLLQHHDIGNCCVGCPSRDFSDDNLSDYLKAVRSILDIKGTAILGVLVMVDADVSPVSAFTSACNALASGGFPSPTAPFAIEELNPRCAVYVM